MDGFQFLLQHAFEFMRVDLAHRHQTEVVDDEGQQFRLFQHQRVALEQGAFARRLDVGVERLQAAGGRLQQFIHQQQQLALEFRALLLVRDDLAHLVQHFTEYMLRVAQHQGADGGADDDDQLDRLPDRVDGAAHQGEASEYTPHHD
ncbi:hypothetical protein D3C72_1767450 [compost metagenome]